MGRDKNKRGGERRRREIEPFFLITRSFWHSPHVSVLGPPARALMIEMHSMYNGANNGVLFLSVRGAAARLGFSDLKAATSAIDELVQLGLITETVSASFSMKADSVSRARAWRLNWIDSKAMRCVGAGALPPLDFSTLTATQKRRLNARQSALKRYVREYAKNRSAVEDSSTLDARRAFAEQRRVEDSSTPKCKNGRKPPNSVVRDSSTHINTIGYGA